MPPAQDDVVRVRLRYPDLETFLEKFSPNVTRGGIFLASREPRPVGEVLTFEVYLASGPPVLSGEGRVTWVKEFNATEPQRAHGMGVQFIYLDPPARPVLDQLLERREAARRRAAGSAAAAAPPPGGPAAGATTDARATRPQPIAFEDFDDRIEESALRRVVDRARVLASRIDDLEALRRTDPEEAPTLAQALAELPRLLSGGRRPTGSFRALGDEPAPPAKPPGEPNGEPGGSR